MEYTASQKRNIYYYSNGIITGNVYLYTRREQKKNLIRYWCVGSEILPSRRSLYIYTLNIFKSHYQYVRIIVWALDNIEDGDDDDVVIII